MESKIAAPAIMYFFCMFFLLLAFYNCTIIILYLCLSIKFCLGNSSQTDTNSCLTPVFPAALLAISISNLYTSAIGSHRKMMVGTEGDRPFPGPFHLKLVLIYASVSSFCWLSVLFHFRHCFSLRHMLYFSIILIIPIGENFIFWRSCHNKLS